MGRVVTPLVSVIMPAHNAGKFIGSAIWSVINQTWPHWELIIVDDASTDNTAEIIAGFEDARIRYMQVERVGSPSGVRNHGLKASRGDMIAFLDADDLYNPTALESLVEKLLQNPEATAAYGFAFYITEDETPLPQHNLLLQNPDGSYRLPPNYVHTWPQIMMGQFSCLLAGLMVRRETLDRVGLLNEAFFSAEDYAFYVRLFIDNLAGVLSVPQYIYRYRVHSGSLTKTPEQSQRVLDSVLRVLEWLFNHPDLPAEAKACESRSLAHAYRYLARERILMNQNELARQILRASMANPRVHTKDWVALCSGLFLRSLLPSSLNRQLVDLRWRFRRAAQGDCSRPNPEAKAS